VEAMEPKKIEQPLSGPFSYVGESNVYLEIADYRMFADPYGPHHPGAVGRIFKLGPASGPFRDKSEEKITYLKSVEPYVFDREMGDLLVPVRVYSQVRIDNEVVLLARIENRPNSRCLYDFHKHHGVKLLITLYPEKWWTAEV